VIGSGLL